MLRAIFGNVKECGPPPSKLSQKVKLAGKTVSRKDKCHCISILNVFPPYRLFV